MKPAADALFIHQQEPPQEWQAALLRVVPRRPQARWFKLVWEPGEEWEPIQRWVVWQMTPEDVTRGMIVADDPRVMGLTDPHPRIDVRFDPEMGCYRKPDGTLAKTDKLTWELYHATGCWGHRFWVIQGEHGGHRYNLSRVEKQILTLGSNGKIRDVPLMGDLPYAPYDERVETQFRRMEHMALARKVYQYGWAHFRELDHEQKQEMEYARALLFDWLGAQFGALYEEFRGHYKAMLRTIPHQAGDKGKLTDGDQFRERFIADISN